jgi:hypothetical protein
MIAGAAGPMAVVRLVGDRRLQPVNIGFGEGRVKKLPAAVVIPLGISFPASGRGVANDC